MSPRPGPPHPPAAVRGSLEGLHPPLGTPSPGMKFPLDEAPRDGISTPADGNLTPRPWDRTLLGTGPPAGWDAPPGGLPPGHETPSAAGTGPSRTLRGDTPSTPGQHPPLPAPGLGIPPLCRGSQGVRCPSRVSPLSGAALRSAPPAGRAAPRPAPRVYRGGGSHVMGAGPGSVRGAERGGEPGGPGDSGGDSLGEHGVCGGERHSGSWACESAGYVG